MRTSLILHNTVQYKSMLRKVDCRTKGKQDKLRDFQINMTTFKVILVAFYLPLAITAANDKEPMIKCDGGSEMLLKIGSTNATMHCHLDKWSSNINISLIKTFSSCLLENSSSPSFIVKDWSKNGSKIIRMMADTVTWGISGNYVLSAKSSNFTLEKKFVIKVSDLPRMPAKVNFTSYMDVNNNHVLALVATLPQRHNCSHPVATAYSFSYQSSQCSTKRGNFPCEVDKDSDGASEDLVCMAGNLLVCEDKELMNCKLNVTITGKNTLGSSDDLSMSSPLLRYTVPALPARGLKLQATGSKSLTFAWLRPYCKTIRFVYKVWLYGTAKSPAKVLTTMDPEVAMKKVFQDLKPYSKYRVCVKVLQETTLEWSRSLCIDNRTLEAIPSKAPQITNISSSSMNQGNGRWRSKIEWKTPGKEFWNGKASIEVEYFDVKTPEIKEKSERISILRNSYVINGLEKGREYTVGVKICTQKGCNQSPLRSASFIVGGKSKEKTSTILYAILGVVAGFGLLFFVLVVYYCKRTSYNEFNNDVVTLENSEIDENEEVRPRTPDHTYEDVGEPRRGYDELNEENRMEDVRLEIRDHADFGAQGMEETELVTVRS